MTSPDTIQSNTHHGHCLCKAVTFSANNPSEHIGACHCTTCRRWGGGPFMSVDCGQDIEFKGQEHIGVYQSSDWAERGFCKECGSHLFYRLKHNQQYIVPAGLFDSGPEATFDHQVFIDEKPHYYSFANDTKNMTAAEMYALFNSSSDS